MRKLLILLLILSLLGSAAATALGESNADQYENAVGLLREYRYAEAGEAFAALGSYGDSPRYTMYCKAIAAGESGYYSIAVDNLRNLGDFLDSKLLATYYAGLSLEASEDYERAGTVLSGISLYRDVAERITGYPERINARDYRIADAHEQANELEEALSGFTALGSYQDSAARAAAVVEKIHARDYAAADEAESKNRLEEALEGFEALGDYSDSADRAEAVKEKIRARDEAAAEKARADAYDAADRAEQREDYAAALSGFTALGDYRDSAARAAAVQNKGNYAQAMQDALEGRFADAFKLFTELGTYGDSMSKAYCLGVTEFAEVSDRKDGIAAFKFHDQWGLININTNTAISPRWDGIGNFNSFGLARVKKDNLYGYINTAGEVVIPCKWYDVSDFNEDGLCTVVEETTRSYRDYYHFGLYDAEGREITPANWQSLGACENSSWGNSYNRPYVYLPRFSDGKTKVQNSDGLYGFIDAGGKTVGEIRWDRIQDFSEGLAVVVEDGKYGFIDKDGKVVIEPQYDDTLSFSEGLAAVKTGSLWQYIDPENRVVIPAKYSNVNPFEDGRADVYLPDTGWQIIDKTGGLIYFADGNAVGAYAAAKALMDAGDYEGAYSAFLKITDYRDASDMAREAMYLRATELKDTDDYQKAVYLFRGLSGYRDADKLAQETLHQKINAQ